MNDNNLSTKLGRIDSATARIRNKLDMKDSIIEEIATRVEQLDLKEYKFATKTINTNGTFNAEDVSVDGFSSVTVDVPIPEYKSGVKTITSNGTFNAESEDLDGYSSITVQVEGTGKEPKLGNIYPEHYTGEDFLYNCLIAEGLSGDSKLKVKPLSSSGTSTWSYLVDDPSIDKLSLPSGTLSNNALIQGIVKIDDETLIYSSGYSNRFGFCKIVDDVITSQDYSTKSSIKMTLQVGTQLDRTQPFSIGGIRPSISGRDYRDIRNSWLVDNDNSFVIAAYVNDLYHPSILMFRVDKTTLKVTHAIETAPRDFMMGFVQFLVNANGDYILIQPNRSASNTSLVTIYDGSTMEVKSSSNVTGKLYGDNSMYNVTRINNSGIIYTMNGGLTSSYYMVINLETLEVTENCSSNTSSEAVKSKFRFLRSATDLNKAYIQEISTGKIYNIEISSEGKIITNESNLVADLTIEQAKTLVSLLFLNSDETKLVRVNNQIVTLSSSDENYIVSIELPKDDKSILFIPFTLADTYKDHIIFNEGDCDTSQYAYIQLNSTENPGQYVYPARVEVVYENEFDGQYTMTLLSARTLFYNHKCYTLKNYSSGEEPTDLMEIESF